MPADHEHHTEEHVHVTWDESRKKKVRAIYGGLVGLGVLIVAYVFGRILLADGDLTLIEAVFIGGFAIAGLMAAMPGTFMPAVHWFIDILERRKGDGS